jgi:uncharacterized membrane protein YphA (DoxX/SURF4 family)
LKEVLLSLLLKKSFTLNRAIIYQVSTYFIAFIWLINGLVCKVLSFVPRHQEIVARILGEDYSAPLTILIGISEIVMAIWIISGFKTRFNAIVQISIISTMNLMEFILVPDLLLWGKANSLFALMLIGLIYYKEFVLRKNVSE